MEIRKAKKSDVNIIMDIIKQAQISLNKMNIDQWQNNYPNIETINNDIDSENSYVVLKDNDIVATVAISFTREKSYDIIYDGKWISNNEYAVIHRIAIDNNYKRLGISSQIIKYAEQLCLKQGIHSIKIDTHEENIPMQNVLKKNNFQYCGIIYLEDETKRVAFEKVL